MSDVHECPVCAQSSLLAVQQRLPGCEVSHDLVVILSTDLTLSYVYTYPNIDGGRYTHARTHATHTHAKRDFSVFINARTPFCKSGHILSII